MQFARLKRFNGKTNKLRNYTVFGIKFVEEKGWYKVADDVAAYLETVTQDGNDPDSLPAFDVVESQEAAQAMDDKERKRAARALAEDANPTVRVHIATKTGVARAHRVKGGDKLDQHGNIVAPVQTFESTPGGGTLTTEQAKGGATHRTKTVKFFEADSAADSDDDEDFVDDMAVTAKPKKLAQAVSGGGSRRGGGAAESGGLSAHGALGASGGDDDGEGDDGEESTPARRPAKRSAAASGAPKSAAEKLAAAVESKPEEGKDDSAK